MPVEIGSHGGRSLVGNRTWLLDAGASLPPRARISSDNCRIFIIGNILPSLAPILADVTQRFDGRLDAVHSTQPNEVYFHAKSDLVPGFCGHLYKKWNARLVSVFADDERQTQGA